MKLEEFKKQLASEATQRAEALEQELTQLKGQLRDKDVQLNKYKNHLRVMFNRCWAIYRNGFCPICGCKELCDKLRDR